jgi:hypothetical protein
MSDVLMSILVGLIIGSCCVVVVAIMLRILPRVAPVKLFIFCILFSEVMLILTGLIFFDHFYLWHASAMNGLIGITNFFVFGAVYKSVSLEMLNLIFSQPHHQASKDFLVDAIGRPCVRGRMELLVEMGWVTKDDEGNYQLSITGSKKVNQLSSVQKFFGIRQSGLYSKT